MTFQQPMTLHLLDPSHVFVDTLKIQEHELVLLIYLPIISLYTIIPLRKLSLKISTFISDSASQKKTGEVTPKRATGLTLQNMTGHRPLKFCTVR